MDYRDLSILVPIDFSDTSVHALREAIGLLVATSGTLTLLHVADAPQLVGIDLDPARSLGAQLETLGAEVAKVSRERLQSLAAEEIPEPIPYRVVVREGFAPSEVLAQVEEGSHDMIVMGTHGRTGFKRVLLGSVTERVLRSSTVPVLVAH